MQQDNYALSHATTNENHIIISHTHSATINSLCNLRNYKTSITNFRYNIIALFMDLSKAFDTIDHNILLHKLYNYGIRGIVWSWIKSYLSNRQQYVSIDDVNSPISHINCGVPQGSILGPLLFLIYINDIVNSSPILSFVLFADDTNILLSHNNLRELINILNLELINVSSIVMV